MRHTNAICPRNRQLSMSASFHCNLDQLNAHTPANGEWHRLKPHLLQVATLAARFARSFGAADVAYLAGLWHDLGKINPEFQEYLKEIQADGARRKGPPHAIWGAALAYRLFFGQSECWKELAVLIAAHHGAANHPSGLEQKLCAFLADHAANKDLRLMRDALRQLPILPARLPTPPAQRDVYIRLLLSCLVDADYLDTERHFEPAKAVSRGEWARPADLWHIFRPDQLRTMWNGRNGSEVNRIRRNVYRACMRSAKLPPGIFRLTVPTGGGKTRSSLAFALRHAVQHPRHGFRRIIVALPYTSIIDQTAREYRRIFGDRLVLEHHSQLDVAEHESQDPQHVRQRWAMENWDHPLIVTTTVQLFESLFSNRAGRCRKLHNIAKSIMILDEVQTLPPALLRPTLDALRVLAEDYGVTVVLSSATQPAFEDTIRLREFRGVPVHEIVSEYDEHFRRLKRVRYERVPEPLTWPEIAQKVRSLDQIMVVLNSRKDAMALINELGDAPGRHHLSTLLCGAHRRKVLDAIMARLDSRHPQYRSGPVRLITTQVVEAGVDLDFPEVWRALGPLERIVQAAGRCNREGRLKGQQGQPRLGRVVIFEPAEGGMPRGAYKTGFEKARLLLAGRPVDDLHLPAFHREYFRRLHEDADDERGRRVQRARKALDFPTVDREYRLIEEDTLPVVVDYADGFERLDQWRRAPSMERWRRLQPYIVSVYEYEARRFLADRWMEPVTDDGNLYRWLGDYDEVLGIRAELDVADLCGV